jgi:hypothetical protein
MGLLLGVFAFQSMASDWRPPESIRPFFEPPAAFADDLGAYRSPLTFDDGSPVETAADWPRRREEILATWRGWLGDWPPLIAGPAIQYVMQTERDGVAPHEAHGEIAPGGQTVAGYLLVPDGTGPFPAVLVVYGASPPKPTRAPAPYA